MRDCPLLLLVDVVVTLKKVVSIWVLLQILIGCCEYSCLAGGMQACSDATLEGHLSDDEGEGGSETGNKKKKLKKKKVIDIIINYCYYLSFRYHPLSQ